jgi:hypothetical protein
MKPVVGRRIGSTRADILLGIMLIGAATLYVEARLGPASTIATSESHTKERETNSLLRRLQRLTGFGSEPDADDLPLPLCAGDCDNDDEVSQRAKTFSHGCLSRLTPWLVGQCLHHSVNKASFAFADNLEIQCQGVTRMATWRVKRITASTRQR